MKLQCLEIRPRLKGIHFYQACNKLHNRIPSSKINGENEISGNNWGEGQKFIKAPTVTFC